MGLMNQIKSDTEQITGNLVDFAMPVILEAPTGQTVEINGIYSDHSNAYDENGMPITGKFTHVTISEQPLIDLGYPTRSSKGLMNFLSHKVTINYADGRSEKYIVDQQRPDYTINLVILILAKYTS
jgi:hypothetical protein